MNLRQLQCFCAVVDAGFNISRAATALHATQPAVSKQLRQFEEELGLDLIQREGLRPVALTPAGERTLTWARRALQSAENIRVIAREGREGVGCITLATSHTHARYILLPAILEFNRRFPRVTFNIMQGAPGQVAEWVRDAKVMLGIANLPEELPRDVLHVPLLTSPRLLIAPAGHPLLDEAELTLEKLAPHPLLVPHSQRTRGARIVRKFLQAGLEPHVMRQALDADVIKTYVAAGLGVGIVPAFTWSAQADAGLCARDVSHLFDPAEAAVLLRRHSQLPKYVYEFIGALDSALDSRRLEALVLERGTGAG